MRMLSNVPPWICSGTAFEKNIITVSTTPRHDMRQKLPNTTRALRWCSTTVLRRPYPGWVRVQVGGLQHDPPHVGRQVRELGPLGLEHLTAELVRVLATQQVLTSRYRLLWNHLNISSVYIIICWFDCSVSKHVFLKLFIFISSSLVLHAL